MSSLHPEAAETANRAQLLQRWLAGRKTGGANPAIAPADRSTPLRASSGQRRLWFQDHAEDVAGDRNIPFAWRLTGKTDSEALFAALDLIVRRHEALRTVFRVDGAELVQEVAEPYTFDREVVSVPAGDDGLTDAVAELLEAETYRPFDLSAGRLLRARLLRTAPDEHILLLVAPHLVVDDWSAATLQSELASAYSALAAASEPSLPELAVQYPDFAEWQRSRLESEAISPAMDYWTSTLRDAPAVLDLPTDRPRPPRSRHRAGWTAFRLSPETTRAVEELAAQEKATPFMVLFAAYSTLLARWSGSRDLVVGSPVAGRALPELEPLIGFFVNTVPLRVRVDRERPFLALLREVRETVLSAMEHQDVPFDHLVQELAPERSSAANPLVQVAFSLNSASGTPPVLPGLTLEPYPVAGRSSRYDLVLALAPEDGGLHGEVVYDSDLFDAPTADRIVAEYLETMRSLVAFPDTPMITLEDDARGRAAAAAAPSDGPATDFDASLNVADLVARTARTDAERTGVCAPDGTLTFDELDRRADALAARLAALGAGPEVPVGVHVGRSLHLVTALIAVWRTGAVFVPLDPAHPVGRLTATVKDVGARILVAGGHSPLAETGLPVVDPAEDPADGSAAEPARRCLPDSLAYIVYTSGTTGEPKGVSITYRNLANLIAALAPLAPPAGGLGGNVMAPSFDGWLWSTVLPLAHGCGVVLADPLEDGAALLRDGVEVVTATPSLLAAHDEPAEGAGPRTVVAAGEACPPTLSRRWSAGRRFVNAYGPSETTICATWADTAAGDDPATIGRPLPNTRVQVLDGYLQPVPDGVPGELFIAGEGVGRGYRNDPGQTASRFLPDPYGNGGRMYRTGDVVRRRADGSLEFVGRADQQLKVRGFRVEPAGIEKVAGSVQGVRAAAVFAVPGPVSDSFGLAVVADGTETDELRLLVRTALRAALPDFMVPAHVICVDRLPLTVTGKVDEAALVEQCSRSAAEEDGTGPAPSTESQLLVARVWSEALGRPVTSLDDNFFELGGHSLVATRVIAALRAETGLRLSMRQLFGRPTVGALATELDRLAAG